MTINNKKENKMNYIQTIAFQKNLLFVQRIHNSAPVVITEPEVIHTKGTINVGGEERKAKEILNKKLRTYRIRHLKFHMDHRILTLPPRKHTDNKLEMIIKASTPSWVSTHKCDAEKAYRKEKDWMLENRPDNFYAEARGSFDPYATSYDTRYIPAVVYNKPSPTHSLSWVAKTDEITITPHEAKTYKVVHMTPEMRQADGLDITVYDRASDGYSLPRRTEKRRPSVTYDKINMYKGEALELRKQMKVFTFVFAVAKENQNYIPVTKDEQGIEHIPTYSDYVNKALAEVKNLKRKNTVHPSRANKIPNPDGLAINPAYFTSGTFYTEISAVKAVDKKFVNLQNADYGDKLKLWWYFNSLIYGDQGKRMIIYTDGSMDLGAILEGASDDTIVIFTDKYLTSVDTKDVPMSHDGKHAPVFTKFPHTETTGDFKGLQFIDSDVHSTGNHHTWVRHYRLNHKYNKAVRVYNKTQAYDLFVPKDNIAPDARAYRVMDESKLRITEFPDLAQFNVEDAYFLDIPVSDHVEAYGDRPTYGTENLQDKGHRFEAIKGHQRFKFEELGDSSADYYRWKQEGHTITSAIRQTKEEFELNAAASQELSIWLKTLDPETAAEVKAMYSTDNHLGLADLDSEPSDFDDDYFGYSDDDNPENDSLDMLAFDPNHIRDLENTIVFKKAPMGKHYRITHKSDRFFKFQQAFSKYFDNYSDLTYTYYYNFLR